MTEPAKARPRPCASCPYRCDVASGVWHPDEYEKLKGYDGETFDQPIATFFCHQGDGHVCSGWLGHRDPADLLAVRFGITSGKLDPSVAEYTTTVPLFESGAEAAEHGMRDVNNPSAKAQKTIDKITKKREVSET